LLCLPLAKGVFDSIAYYDKIATLETRISAENKRRMN